jgi:hypothetical protein
VYLSCPCGYCSLRHQQVRQGVRQGRVLGLNGRATTARFTNPAHRTLGELAIELAPAAADRLLAQPCDPGNKLFASATDPQPLVAMLCCGQSASQH